MKRGPRGVQPQDDGVRGCGSRRCRVGPWAGMRRSVAAPEPRHHLCNVLRKQKDVLAWAVPSRHRKIFANSSFAQLPPATRTRAAAIAATSSLRKARRCEGPEVRAQRYRRPLLPAPEAARSSGLQPYCVPRPKPPGRRRRGGRGVGGAWAGPCAAAREGRRERGAQAKAAAAATTSEAVAAPGTGFAA